MADFLPAVSARFQQESCISCGKGSKVILLLATSPMCQSLVHQKGCLAGFPMDGCAYFDRPQLLKSMLGRRSKRVP